MSRHRTGRKWRRKDLLAEIDRLNGVVSALQADRAALLRHISAPGSDDETVYMPVPKFDHTPAVPLITPDGRRTTVRTGAQRRPRWAQDG